MLLHRRSLHSLATRLLAVALAATLPGCATNPSGHLERSVVTLPADSRIVVMPPDIRYYLMTAGGNPELHEVWTADAESVFAESIAGIAAARGIDLRVLRRDELDAVALQFEGLHAALGEALVEHSVLGSPLPSKGDNAVSDWTLGPGVGAIRDATGADYALFVHYRENQASGSRIAFAILAAAARVVIPTSSEHGFATLVNLETGDVAWFALLHDDGYEIREKAGADYVADRLLQALPVQRGSFADTAGMP